MGTGDFFLNEGNQENNSAIGNDSSHDVSVCCECPLLKKSRCVEF
jgi:hypothetical protein